MKKILLIEDNAFIRENTAQILEFAGYQVIVSANGDTGLETAQAMRPDLVISDIMMPGLSGFEILAALRANPETSAIPFVFLSARATPESVEMGLEAGAQAYLIKPFHEQELLETVTNCLNGRQCA